MGRSADTKSVKEGDFPSSDKGRGAPIHRAAESLGEAVEKVGVELIATTNRASVYSGLRAFRWRAQQGGGYPLREAPVLSVRTATLGSAS